MRIKIFSVPVIGGDALNAELNAFLGSRKVLQVEKQLVNLGESAYWSFCITYLDGVADTSRKKKVDYKQVLDEASFQRFSKMREIRKQLAQAEGVPAFAIFTDEELAGLAKWEVLTAANMKAVKGIGEKKLEKYGPHFLNSSADEESR